MCQCFVARPTWRTICILQAALLCMGGAHVKLLDLLKILLFLKVHKQANQINETQQMYRDVQHTGLQSIQIGDFTHSNRAV